MVAVCAFPKAQRWILLSFYSSILSFFLSILLSFSLGRTRFLFFIWSCVCSKCIFCWNSEYSMLHLDPRCWIILYYRRNLLCFKGRNWMSVVGTVMSSPKIKRQASFKSLRFEYKGVKGQKFKMKSIWDKITVSSMEVNLTSATTRLRECFSDATEVRRIGWLKLPLNFVKTWI